MYSSKDYKGTRRGLDDARCGWTVCLQPRTHPRGKQRVNAVIPAVFSHTHVIMSQQDVASRHALRSRRTAESAQLVTPIPRCTTCST